jgi:hypothetical protein
MNGRVIEPEWLDELPATDSGALTSRRDLQRLNALMNHATIIARALSASPAPKRVLDLGAGDGAFTLRVATQAGWHGTDIVLLDRAAAVAPGVEVGFRARHCTVTAAQCDVLNGFADIGNVDCILANLFLHHFDHADLAQLLTHAAAHCTVFVACEPRRSSFALFASRLVGLIGCNAITRHDAVASVRAGFRGDEISQHWPSRTEWSIEERGAGLFSHVFIARKL